MSANDLIRRIDAVKAVRWGDSVTEAHNNIRAIPAVPQEMSAIEYLTAEQRMCFDENIGKRNCVNCPLSSSINPARINCGDYSREHPDKAVAAVEQWAREHPEVSE